MWIGQFFASLREETSTERERVLVKRPPRMWCVELFGILRCAQNDSKNRQLQIQMQRQVPWLADGFVPTHRKLRDGCGTGDWWPAEQRAKVASSVDMTISWLGGKRATLARVEVEWHRRRPWRIW
jgi:hypothetical protein